MSRMSMRARKVVRMALYLTFGELLRADMLTDNPVRKLGGGSNARSVCASSFRYFAHCCVRFHCCCTCWACCLPDFVSRQYSGAFGSMIWLWFRVGTNILLAVAYIAFAVHADLRRVGVFVTALANLLQVGIGCVLPFVLYSALSVKMRIEWPQHMPRPPPLSDIPLRRRPGSDPDPPKTNPLHRAIADGSAPGAILSPAGVREDGG
eukprot:CAMPEP_0196772906 /NCGR_PEP_ID=MMETSP1104-20130614/2484_1 /TAXON_ID=33652 /ORGANISM="Cafeteria sp., Strain Caron Lab Isolate" /LENGTH=206 /DNA_ID=CAMNT_0042143049 /DNA_START=95 /DNA_END=712 /DNA_ORIENTATION=+